MYDDTEFPHLVAGEPGDVAGALVLLGSLAQFAAFAWAIGAHIFG